MNIDFGDSTPFIEDTAFDETAWYNKQPDGIVYAGLVAYTIKGTLPENVTIKDGTKVIMSWLFNPRDPWDSRETLKSITIPNSVTTIGEYAFFDCKGLTNIYALWTEPKDYSYIFYHDTYNKARLHVPIGCRNAYATTSPWRYFENIIDDIELTGIEDVIADSNSETHKQITDYYNLQGQRTTRLQRGVNIIRYSDGTTKKVLVK